ncbi:MAG TPA: helix-turn-helix transcriptional regulator, partial [Solirubrobacter sp.]|nr:helix-turn-helix transcriptional regulator [Solirubrobacter sp.]
SRRARLTPDEAGLYVLDGDVRRVPGLRREEVADLAGVSADYYTQLERGDVDGASDSVLNAVARALRLDDAERLHLFDLARPEAPTRLMSSRGLIRPSVQRTLDAFTGGMALVRNRRWDYLAANTLGRAVYAEVFDGRTGPPNHVRYVFLDDRAREFFDDWPAVAHDTARILRSEAGCDSHDPAPAESSRSSCRPAPSSAPSGHSTTCASRQRACTASTTRSSATSTSSSRPPRCGQTPA